nr:MAG TPA: hypothetical protein [Caudoviricetes sp.]DAH61172.1 MAG TPA: hypothetical protein [Caudoviricetes sp.]
MSIHAFHINQQDDQLCSPLHTSKYTSLPIYVIFILNVNRKIY